MIGLPLRSVVSARLAAPCRRYGAHRSGTGPAAMVLCAAAALAGCGAEGAAPPVVVRDSAGITIVHSSGPAWSDGAGWRLSAAPTLEIGMLDGPPEQQFTQIRSAFFLDDGRIVAANMRHPPEVRVFSPDGQHLVSMGGAGEGPGEFGSIMWAHLAGDSIVIFDMGRRRLTFFGLDGALSATVPVQVAMTQPMEIVFWTRLGDGSLLGQDNRIVPADARGRGRAATTLLRFAPDGSATDTVATIPGFEYDIPQPGQGGPVRFGLRTSFLAAGDRLYVGAGDAFRIDVQDLHGRLLRSIRLDHVRRPVRDADLEAQLAAQLERARSDDERARIRQSFAALSRSELMPAHGSAMLLDAVDHLWVEGYHAPTDSGRQWHVFDPDGRYLGEVEVPGELRVVDVAADQVLGIWRDDLDVESIRRYRLIKDPRAQAD
jgi:hypothetical protein